MKKLIILGGSGFVGALIVATVIRILTAPAPEPADATDGAKPAHATTETAATAQTGAPARSPAGTPEQGASVAPEGGAVEAEHSGVETRPQGNPSPTPTASGEAERASQQLGAGSGGGVGQPVAAKSPEGPGASEPVRSGAPAVSDEANATARTAATVPGVAARPSPAQVKGPSSTPEGPLSKEAKELKLLAKILVNMKPAEAAKVMKDLPDEQVQRLIVAMGPRPAATILAQLPPERAAAVSRRLLEAQAAETQ